MRSKERSRLISTIAQPNYQRTTCHLAILINNSGSSSTSSTLAIAWLARHTYLCVPRLLPFVLVLDAQTSLRSFADGGVAERVRLDERLLHFDDTPRSR